MTNRIRLLICEDSDDDAVLVADRLRRGGIETETERVETAAAMVRALRLRPPDLVISDYNIPGFGAEEALRLLRQSGLDVPFILVSGRIGDESAVNLMRQGAHDFILKDRMARLVPAIRRELQQARARRERREAEAALHVSEERFRLFAEHAPDVLFRCRIHPTAEVEYFSPAAGTVLGCRPRDLLGDPRTVLALVADEDRPGLEASWHSPGPDPLVVRWHRPDGTQAWTEQRAAALRDETGRVVAVEGILRDVTDRVAADAERDRLEQQLRQAERLESLGRLAGGIAHDFNNLLAVILGHTELALSELPQDGAQRARFEIVRQLAERGAGLTRQLLVFSRQEPLRPEILDVNRVVADTERILRGVVGEDVEFVTHLDPGLRTVRIDRGELERLLLNLVANSRRAMPHGGRLTIRTRAMHGASARPGPDVPVRLTVTDTGVGMSERVAKHAFEPFFTTDRESGTGLGLSAVYGVVKAAGGEISLSSEAGIGTCFTIDLPAADRPVEDGVGAEPVPTGGRGERVLVVEDNADVRDMVVLMLHRSGYQVVESSTPERALAVLDDADPPVDLLLTDIVMPGMSGMDLARRARATLPGLPVLLMSGHTAGVLTADTPLPPDTALIRKPFTAATLLNPLDELLGHRDS